MTCNLAHKVLNHNKWDESILQSAFMELVPLLDIYSSLKLFGKARPSNVEVSLEKFGKVILPIDKIMHIDL